MTIVYGTNSNDTLTGSSADEVFHGLSGSDSVLGGGGNDTFYAEGGVLVTDSLIGGQGNDSFYFDGLTNAYITTGTGKDVIYFDGVFPSFTVSDFDPTLDRIVIDNSFWIKNGLSDPSLASISSSGTIPSSSVFIKITDTIANPTSSTDVANAIFNLNDAAIAWPDAVILVVGNATDTVLWRFTSDSTPKIQSSQLDYLGMLSGLNIGNFTDRVLTFQNHSPSAVADAATIAEDGLTQSGNVLTNDTDVDFADTKSVTTVGASSTNVGAPVSGSYGTLTLNADGSYNYSLDSSLASVQALKAGASLTDTFSYTMADAWGDTSTANIVLTIAGTNDNPVAVADTGTGLIEDSGTGPPLASTGNVLTNDTDVDSGDTKTVSQLAGQAVTVSKVVAGTYGSLTINSSGSYSYTLNNIGTAVQSLKQGQTVTDSFAYTMIDSASASSSSTLNFSIAGANDAPAAHISLINQSAFRDFAFDFTIPSSTFTDVEGDAMSYSAVLADGSPLPTGLTFDTSSFTFSGTNNVAAGNYIIKVVANDSVSDGFTTFILTVQEPVAASGNGKFVGGITSDYFTGADGAAADKMEGGNGDDIYIIDNLKDKITEKPGTDSGSDSVYSSINYKLGANLENLTLTGTDAINGTGNELANTLTGNASNNILDGGKQVDTYIGGDGDDTYILDSLLETDITEYVGEGNDTIKLKINTNGEYALSDSSEVENLTITGSGLINLTGNGLDNSLTGNAKANTLTGLDGNDTLNGGAGVDTLIGGDGDDTYIVDKATDVVTELAGEGTDDTIISNTGLYVLSDTSEVENLTIGKGAGKGTGNALDNTLTGNDSANTLDGAAGNDILNGGKGADKLLGGEGADTLNGGLGNDKLTGNAGADIFIFNEPLKGNVDTITDFQTGEDTLQLDTTLVFTNAILAADADGVLDVANFRADDSLAHLKAAQEADDFILYDTKAGVLYYDADGNGTDFSAVKFATLTKIVGVAPAIDAGDIALV